MPTDQPKTDEGTKGEDACWFVERHANAERGRWLAGFHYDNPQWTNDPDKSIRFCRKEDASVICQTFGIFDGIGKAAQSPFPTEHIFIASSRPIALPTNDWIPYSESWEQFKNDKLDKVGTQVLICVPDSRRSAYLIGDINDITGICDHCTAFGEDVIVERYRVLLTIEVLNER